MQDPVLFPLYPDIGGGAVNTKEKSDNRGHIRKEIQEQRGSKHLEKHQERKECPDNYQDESD
jgi:hypothetical protein